MPTFSATGEAVMNNEYKLTRTYNGIEVSMKTLNVDMDAEELLEFFKEFMLACGYVQQTVDGVCFNPWQPPH